MSLLACRRLASEGARIRMRTWDYWNHTRRLAAAALAGVLLLPAPAAAQDRLKTMPGYEQYQRMSKEIARAVKPGTSAV